MLMGKPKAIPELEGAIEALPAFPKSVQKVLEMTSDLNCMPRDLIDVLETDPVLTGRILKLVNSAYIALARRVDSLRHALVYLGLNTIKHMAMGLAAVGAMPKETSGGISMLSFQKDALAGGEAVRIAGAHLLARQTEQDQLYLMGLFHNLGDVLCAVYAPEQWKVYSELPPSSIEDLDEGAIKLFGLPPREIAARVLEKWEMEPEISQGLRELPHAGEEGSSRFSQSLWIALSFLEKERPTTHSNGMIMGPGTKEMDRILALLLEYPADVLTSIDRSERFLIESAPN
jgi:HD-like signal output (HDOD) protein